MKTEITRHPDDANLMSYAAGTLPEALAAAVAAHVRICPRCQEELETMRALGGALLEEAEGGEGGELPASLPSLAEASPSRPTPAAPQSIAARYLADLDGVPWRWLGPGIHYCPLPLSPGATGDLRLLKISPGRKMPEHGHGGTEMTLVLRGAYRDESGAFRAGDMQDVDGDHEHQPIVDPAEGCICLVAAEHPARFKGVIGRLLQPWTRM